MCINDNYITDNTEWLNNIGAAAFVINSDSKVVFWNRACEELTGISSSRVLNTNQHWMGLYDHERPCLADMVMDDSWEQKASLYDFIDLAASSSRGLIARNWCQTPVGTKFLIFEANAIFDNHGDLVGAVETISDATDLKSMQERILVFSKAIENCSSSIVITDPTGRIKFANSRFSVITGYSNDEAVDNNINFIRAENEIYDQEISTKLMEDGEWHGELRSIRKDGSLYWDRCSISNILDEDGRLIYHVFVQEDITHEYENAEKLNYIACHDQLTGLVNRREFESRLQEVINSDSEEEHALCFIDLDKFKIVNDSCGHSVGDKVLKQLADLLTDKLKDQGLLGRVGGDEFSILIKNSNYKDTEAICLSLIKEIKDYRFVWENRPFTFGMSVGAVMFKAKEYNLTELFNLADTACYMAKELGTNRLHFYTADDNELTLRHEQKKWLIEIEKALNEGLFHLDAQAIVPMQDSDELHYEILIRMKNEQGDKIPPNIFLPAAERGNLMIKVDCYVVKHTLDLLKASPQFLKDIHFISINLSGQSLADESLLDFILNEFERTGIPGNKICFEITETATITHLSKAKQLIHSLKKIGCLFALDDFGSGLSSFAYLKNLPVDYLKIDGIFVRDIAKNKIDRELVKSINQVGHALEMKTIAEFVEDDETISILKEINVDYAQGYCIMKPSSFEDIISNKTVLTYQQVSA